MSDPFIGPLPYAEIPEQPKFEAWCVDWRAWDVPRIWDVLSKENNPTGWEQVSGFRQLSILLVEQYRRLMSQHFDLSQAWQSPAAEAVLSRMDSFAQSMLSDANCATRTARALDGIMTTYADAQVKVAALDREWGRVTTDWVPEWWDKAAAELNVEAQQVMFETDSQVRDYRSNIIIPDYYDIGRLTPTTTIDSSVETQQGPHPALHIPPMPGYDPLSPSARGGAELTSMVGAPFLVPAVPGQAVSMLPVPPGNQFAPFGGAYILPGPGVGRAGYLVPMPQALGGPAGGGGRMGAPGRAGAGYGAGGFPGAFRPGATGAVGGGAGVGMMPMPLGATPPGVGGPGGFFRGRPDTVWQVQKGVPPVIQPVGDDVFVPDQPTKNQEDAFKEWFAELAYPWRSENKSGSEPQVVLRRVAE